ncbi:MAG TPA: hypothetical protein VD736_04890 [Nitrososphaera sp.]|nr:hypothetical protein [Nitrososphaera sp.]
MQVSKAVSKQRKSALASNPGFITRASLLGGFVGLVGYLAVACHHLH